MTTSLAPTMDYNNLFRSLETAIIIFSAEAPDFVVIEENEAHASMAMVNRDEIIGKPVLEAFPDTSAQFKKDGVSQLIESLKRVKHLNKSEDIPLLKYDLKDQSGTLTEKYWRVTHSPLRDEAGDVIGIFQTTVDITGEVIAKKQLDRTRNLLNQALANGSIATWVWNIGSKEVHLDDNLVQILGVDSLKATGSLTIDEFFETIYVTDRSRVRREMLEAARDSSISYESEYRISGPNDDLRWVIARGRIDDGLEDFSCAIVDITERKTAESNLEFLVKANQQFSASLDRKELLQTIATVVVENIADWCIIDLANDDGKLEETILVNKDPNKIKEAEIQRREYGNVNIAEGFGVQEVFLTGESVLYPSITNELIKKAVPDETQRRAIAQLGVNSAIIVPLRAEGKIIGTITLISIESQIHYGSSALSAANGLADRIALALYNSNLYQEAQHEIKARERLQKQLEESNKALETRVRQRTQQLEKTNSGLKTEITRRVALEVELNKKSDNLTRSNQELQDFAYVASHDLQEPLRKIQAFGDLLESEYASELGDGAQYLDRMRNAASRMSTLIEDLLAFSRVSTKQRPIVEVDLNEIVDAVVGDLETRLQRTGGSVEVGPLPKLWADPMHMRQLFQNLIGNALKFHKPDCAPEVHIYAAPSQPDNANHVICIKDNGIGFDEKYLDRIFSVFQRLHGRETYEGTGIGLAVCRKIAERYDGKITATSKKDDGATFIFTIPRKEKEIHYGTK